MNEELESQKINKILMQRAFNLKMMGHHTEIPNSLLKQPEQHYNLDTYVGVIQYFNWLNIESNKDRNYNHILYMLEECKKKYGNKRLFDLLKRKITYINLLHKEVKYISERYDWKKLKGCSEIFLSKFEDLITSSCELLLNLLNIYEDKKQKRRGKWKKYNEFKSIVYDLENDDISPFCKSINHYLFMHLLIYIRNCLVHNPKCIVYTKIESQNPKIWIRNMYTLKDTHLYDVVLDYFEKYYKGKKGRNRKIKQMDMGFNGFKYSYTLNKNNKPDRNICKISYNNNILELCERLYGIIFIIEIAILKKMQ